MGLGLDWASTLFVTGAGTPAYVFGPLVGPFFEYHIDRQLAIGLDTRFGAIISANEFGTNSRFGLRAQMVLAYRL
jgi:hypothetical protein